MTNPIPVHSALERYRVAAAELPVSTRLAGDGGGAIVAVGGGDGWCDATVRAFGEGAAAVVVSRPVSAPAQGLAAVHAAAAGRPVVIERPLLRADIAQLVVAAGTELSPPAALVGECHAPALALPSALRDALGWARIMGRSPLVLRSPEATRAGGIALLETSAGTPVSLVFATQPGAPERGRLRLTALGPTLQELDGDEADLQFTMTDAASRSTASPRFERAERVALRRAAAALVDGGRPSDLDDLALDATLAAALGAASVL